MNTSIVWIALISSAGSAAALPKVPSWHMDYAAAQKQGAETKKPLAVVIGHGANGWESITGDGQMDPAVGEMLQSKFVCVYIDTAMAEGEKLAGAFEMKHGLVLSDRSGEKQAYRHVGTLSNGDLSTVLTRYADPERPLTRTESNVQEQIRYYPPGASNYFAPYFPTGGSCPNCRR